MQEIETSAKLVCVHDSARPLVLAEDIRKVFDYLTMSLKQHLSDAIFFVEIYTDSAAFINSDVSIFTRFSLEMLQVLKDAAIHGAAVLGVPVKATIKEVISVLYFQINFHLFLTLRNVLCCLI